MAKEKKAKCFSQGLKVPSIIQIGKSIPFVRDPSINQCKALSSQHAASVLAKQLFWRNRELGDASSLELPVSCRCLSCRGTLYHQAFPIFPFSLPRQLNAARSPSRLRIHILQFTASNNQGLSLVLVWWFCCRLEDVFSKQQQLGRLVFLFRVQCPKQYFFPAISVDFQNI